MGRSANQHQRICSNCFGSSLVGKSVEEFSCSHSLRQSSGGMVLRARTCKDAVMMHLLRSLHFFLAKWDIALTSQHIPGATNHAADALSRNNMQAFHSMMQDASPLTAVPQMLWDLLVTERPDWTSVSWRSKLCSLST